VVVDSTRVFPVILVVTILFLSTGTSRAEIFEYSAKDTLATLEMEHGDELRFRLRNGRVVSLVLERTDAAIVEEVKPGGTVYRFSADVRIDRRPMRLERYVCSQECFYEPWVVNGLRIWLDTVRDVFDLIPVRYPRTGNLQCVPRKAARLAVQDATLRICPDRLQPWIEHDGPTLDVGKCYNGDDCYLGPYLGEACHVGMDINHAKGSLLFAPIRFDTQAYFNSLAAGDNNNRWRGIRRWPNGDIWALQSHHLIELLVAENVPLEPGVKYATTAGVHVGSHQHTHFEFKVGRPRRYAVENPASMKAPIDFDDDSEDAQERPEVLHLDPWIVFWQAFEDRKEARGEIRAVMRPLRPVQVGEEVEFSAAGSRPGPNGEFFRYSWSFGDTGTAEGPMPTYTFPRPGVFPVRLIVDDGKGRDSTTQWVTVGGTPSTTPALRLVCSDEPSFRNWPVAAPSTYGHSAGSLPHTVCFVARPSRPQPAAKSVFFGNRSGGSLGDCRIARIEYHDHSGWLVVEPIGRIAERSMELKVDASGMEPGVYSASVQVSCPGALNGVQRCRVEMTVPSEPPKADVIIDDADPGFYATPYFWVGHRFCRCPADRRGCGGFYLTNGRRAARGEFARFAPDLNAGKYIVSLSEETPFAPGVEFDVRVRHAGGDEAVRMRPEESRKIGTFEFHEGADGFVEILAEGSKGLVIADAVQFRKE
jgi:hypothetical protein